MALHHYLPWQEDIISELSGHNLNTLFGIGEIRCKRVYIRCSSIGLCWHNTLHTKLECNITPYSKRISYQTWVHISQTHFFFWYIWSKVQKSDHIDTEQCLEGNMKVACIQWNSTHILALHNIYEDCSVCTSSNTWKFDAKSLASYSIYTKVCVYPCVLKSDMISSWYRS